MVPDSALVPDAHCRVSVPEFSGNSFSFNGTMCTNEVKFLRMAWNGATPLVRPCSIPFQTDSEPPL